MSKGHVTYVFQLEFKGDGNFGRSKTVANTERKKSHTQEDLNLQQKSQTSTPTRIGGEKGVSCQRQRGVGWGKEVWVKSLHMISIGARPGMYCTY